MAIFHELYGVYYRVVSRILERTRLTRREGERLIQEEGFRDSVLFLPAKLFPQADGSDWGLLRENADGTFSPVTKHRPPRPLTLLQKRWLRTRLDDPRMGLFLSAGECAALRERLSGVKPLYQPGTFLYTDQFLDGDLFDDPHFCADFRELLHAAQNRQIVDVSYRSGHGRSLRLRVVPFRLEYSEKNDKLRAYCIRTRSGRKAGVMVLNLGRILSLKNTGEQYQQEIDAVALFADLRCKEPAIVRVLPERNAVERFLMEFASYEKRTERDIETGVLTVTLWYDSLDETELLIRLLSYGPVLEILSPANLRSQAAERLQKQLALWRKVSLNPADYRKA